MKTELKTAFAYEGRLTVALSYTEHENYALLQSVAIGHYNTSEIELSDAEDILLYCKMLSEIISMPVYRNHNHANATKDKDIGNWELWNIILLSDGVLE